MGERGSHLSVSQVKLADKCSLAWRYRYIDKIPEPEEGARKVFGTVVHVGTENWYGEPGSDMHVKTNLRDHVHKVWWDYLPMDVAVELRHCITAERDLVGLEQLVKIARPEIKAPRATKEFLSSPQFKVFEDARDGMLNAMNKCTDMRWSKNENAFQAYQKSMHIANQLEALWKNRPRPFAIEYEFIIEIAGIEIKGRIDQVRVEPHPITGDAQVEGLDLKTGANLMSQMDAFLQAFIYDEACRQTPDLPDADFWTFWMARHNKPQRGKIEPERHRKLAERILNRVKRQIESGDYAPQYSLGCNMCDYKSLCEKEISIWEPGTDSLVLDFDSSKTAILVS